MVMPATPYHAAATKSESRYQPPPATAPMQQPTAVVVPGVRSQKLPEAQELLPQSKEFDHNGDYSSLTGKLYFSPRTNTWLLRYMPIEQEDQFGGVVTIVGMDPADRALRPGLTVTVRGKMADPTTSDLSPHYMLQEIRVVGE